jgi:hypothetical protein
MMQKHTWTGVAHNDFGFLFHIWAVAVDNAFAAGGFLFLKGTFIEPQKSVILEFLAASTQFAFGVVVVFAVEFNYMNYSLFFTFHAFMCGVRGLRLHTHQE